MVCDLIQMDLRSKLLTVISIGQSDFEFYLCIYFEDDFQKRAQITCPTFVLFFTGCFGFNWDGC